MPIASFRKEIIMQLASRFASRSPVLRADYPLSDDQIRTVAPSIFAVSYTHLTLPTKRIV